MDKVQKTSVAGSAGLAAFVLALRFHFQDIPVNEFFDTLKVMNVNQLVDILVPLILGVTGLFYDEDKVKK